MVHTSRIEAGLSSFLKILILFIPEYRNLKETLVNFLYNVARQKWAILNIYSMFNDTKNVYMATIGFEEGMPWKNKFLLILFSSFLEAVNIFY